jgi:hypothetical protein
VLPWLYVSRACIVAVLLILTLGSSASVCVVGSGDTSSKSCARSKSDPGCARKSLNAAQCGKRLNAPRSNCGIRGLAQFHFFAFPQLETGAPLRILRGRVSIPSGTAPRVSSIGSPETDRGPPAS